MTDCEQTGLLQVTSGQGEMPIHLRAVHSHTLSSSELTYLRLALLGCIIGL
jgi:hypothetical protein